ncbi:hypothetical protein IV203_022554 [Nitzschia inconspicua]|uniref:Uncharacterized protein n=1 Tax=Nitzschia inconspicua TaxID=303405 RepID=A0A9K3PF40_9STRA|nr:hypothetical protein IV203_022554 [Nitzschia inconspicua]
MDPSNNLAKTFQSNSKMIEYEPSLMRSCAKGNQLMGGKSTTNTTISKSLKLSIAKELFASSKMSRAASKGQVPKMTTQNASVSNDATSRKTNQLYPSSSRASLSAALNRSASKLSRKTQDDSLEGGDDYESRLSEPASLRSTTSHSCLQSRRSCLKKDGDKSTRRSVNRSASADQLSFQVRLPGNRKPVVRTRSITFDESVRVRRVTSISELSKGRSNELWFNTEEYNVIKRKTFNLIRAVQNGDTAGVNYCTRGLEKYFDAQKVQHTRAAAWESVLSAQEGQRRNGSYDDLQLSQAYSAVSSQCMEEACKRGQLDHESIERYLHKTKKIMRTQSLPSAAMIAAASHKSQS